MSNELMSKELETARKKAIGSIVIKLVLCLAAGMLGVLVTKSEGSAVFCILGFLLLYSSALVFLGLFATNRAYARWIPRYKRNIIQDALNVSPICDDMEFKPDCGLHAELVNSTGLLPTGSFFSNCYLSGTYNGVRFCQAEVRSVRAGRDGGSLEYDGTLISFPTALPEARQTNIYDRQADIAVIPVSNTHL
ncbi:MAG: hypothetical protein K2N94_13120, partial [Lachnospiraceae bacterium]|nr:hypothetical protein [Lachnospiraceae bacterium]